MMMMMMECMGLSLGHVESKKITGIAGCDLQHHIEMSLIYCKNLNTSENDGSCLFS